MSSLSVRLCMFYPLSSQVTLSIRHTLMSCANMDSNDSRKIERRRHTEKVKYSYRNPFVSVCSNVIRTLQHTCMCRQRWENIQDICYVLMCHISWNCGEMSLFSFVLFRALEREIGEECVVCAFFTLASQNVKWVKRRKPDYVVFTTFLSVCLSPSSLIFLVLYYFMCSCSFRPLISLSWFTSCTLLFLICGWLMWQKMYSKENNYTASIAILGRQGHQLVLKQSNNQGKNYFLSSHFLNALRKPRKTIVLRFSTAIDIPDHFSSFLFFCFLSSFHLPLLIISPLEWNCKKGKGRRGRGGKEE